MSQKPEFYAIDALDAYPEAVGTLDKIEHSDGALWVHLNGKRSKLVGLQSLAFLISQLEQIRAKVFGGAAETARTEHYKNTTQVTLYNDELQGRLHLADELIREAWRLMDGQDGKTSGWHLLASHYINNPEAPGVDIKAIGLIDTARVDLYERLHMQEFALVPYFDDSVGQWFIPPADHDQHDGQTFGTWRQAIDSLAQVGEQPVAPVAELGGLQWEDFQQIANKPGVHYALAGFSADSTGDNGVAVVQAVIEALKNPASRASPCIDCHGEGFCMSIMHEEIRCPCNAPIQFSKSATEG